jgi:hypothetical protein
MSPSFPRSESMASTTSNYSEVSEEEACVFAPGSPTGHQARIKPCFLKNNILNSILIK